MTELQRISIIIISLVIFSSLVFGMQTQVFAQSNPYLGCPDCNNTNNVQQVSSATITVTTDKPSYNNEDMITITGHASQTNSNSLVTLRIFNSNQNLVSVTQVLPDSNGDFTKTILATGPLWTNAGTFTIVAQYGAGSQPVTTTFYYNGGTGTTTIIPAITSNPTSSPLSANSTINPSTHSKIPNWVKGVFNFYAQGNLSDDDLIKALQFLIQQGIIKV